jgi:transposase InsO family protein
MMRVMLLRLAYLGVANALAMLRLLPMGDHDKDVEILVLRHQITVLERKLHGERPRFTAADRALLAALLQRLPRDVLHLDDARMKIKYVLRDRDGKYPQAFDAILADVGMKVVLSGVRVPRMNSLIERWIQSCRHELLDRTLIWNQSHLLRVLREYEQFHNAHRPHRGLGNARPPRPLPEPITDPAELAQLRIHRCDRPGGILREYEHAA